MYNAVIGLLGAGAGVFFAVFSSRALLPYVLRSQDRHFAAGNRFPIIGLDKDQLAAVTRFVYRFVMPIFFGIMGATLAVTSFGAKP